MTATPATVGEIRFETTTITPAYAKYLLDTCNTHNRNLNKSAVSRYAADMRAGEWTVSNDAIVISANNVLLNGQHRLSAIVESGVTVTALIGYNFPASTQNYMDSGKVRTTADVMSLEGEKNSADLAAVATRAWLWKRGVRGVTYRCERPTRQQQFAIVREHPELRNSVSAVLSIKRIAPRSVLGLCHWLFNAIDETACREFFARLHDGVNMDDGNPILVLRNVLIANQMSKRTKLRDEMVMAYIIKAWNAYREGRKIKVLRLTLAGDAAETFPEPV